LCAATDFANKAAAVEGLRNSVGVVNRNLGQFLRQSLKPAYSIAEADIREFVNTHSVWTDATSIVASAKAEFLHRVEGRIPPRYGDKAKEENSFGDFIFWRQVLAHADSNPVLILTNDCKTDWVHVVSRIENYQGKPLGRTPQTGFDAQSPHPFLTFEAGERGIPQLEVINVGNLVLFLEMEQPQSAKYLVAASYPRGLDESPIPNWAAFGIQRPPETAVTDVSSITLHSLRLNALSQSLKQALRLLRGEREGKTRIIDLDLRAYFICCWTRYLKTRKHEGGRHRFEGSSALSVQTRAEVIPYQ
jgi:PIN like domain